MYTVDRNKLVQPIAKQYGGPSKTNRTSICPSSSTPEYIYEGSEISLSKIYLSIAALSTIVKIYRNNLRVHWQMNGQKKKKKWEKNKILSSYNEEGIPAVRNYFHKSCQLPLAIAWPNCKAIAGQFPDSKDLQSFEFILGPSIFVVLYFTMPAIHMSDLMLIKYK